MFRAAQRCQIPAIINSACRIVTCAGIWRMTCTDKHIPSARFMEVLVNGHWHPIKWEHEREAEYANRSNSVSVLKGFGPKHVVLTQCSKMNVKLATEVYDPAIVGAEVTRVDPVSGEREVRVVKGLMQRTPEGALFDLHFR